MLNQATLSQFIGDMKRFRHGFCKSLLYTPGVQYINTNGGKNSDGAYWLLDAIASYQRDRRINTHPEARYLQFWKLTVDDGKGTLTCDDGNGNVLITQKFHEINFSLPEIQVWVGCNGDGTRTAYLPSEH